MPKPMQDSERKPRADTRRSQTRQERRNLRRSLTINSRITNRKGRYPE